MIDLVLYGPVSPESPARLDRRLDRILLDMLNRGRSVNLTGGRQRGKTTTLLWLRQSLANQGAASSYVDLSPFGGAVTSSPEDWIRLTASAVVDSLMPAELRNLAPTVPSEVVGLQKFFVELAGLASERSALIVVFDEISAVPEELRRPFFYAIRSLLNMRVDVGRPAGVDRLQFVFSGAFDPERLIPNTANSPFNVSETVQISEFDYDAGEVKATLGMAGSHLDPGDVLRLTDGHPYLTNRVATLSADVPVEEIPGYLLARSDANLGYVARSVGASPELLAMAEQITKRKDIPFVPGIDTSLADLRSLGLIKPDARNMTRISGDIYSQMLTRICAFRGTRDETIGVAAGVLDFVEPAGIRGHLEGLLGFAAENSATQPALAAVCIGAVVEGALFSTLESRNDLRTLTSQLNGEIGARPDLASLKFSGPGLPLEKWTFAQMIEVARLGGIVTGPSSQLSHAIRDWRNLIHPAGMRKAYPDGVPAEVSEAAVATGHLLLREIRDSVVRARATVPPPPTP